MLKPSLYNYIWPLETAGTLLFNSISTAFMEIDNEYLFLLEEEYLNIDDLTEEQRKVIPGLTKGGFLVEEFVDETQMLKYRNWNGKFNKDHLALTIIPTFACNLKCFYCYQGMPSREIMSAEVQDKIIEFIAKSTKGLKSISVNWFGGEPLIAWDMIQNLSQRIIGIAAEHDLKYSAGMISNGTLLDEEKIRELNDLAVKSVQLTLDGPPRLHSRRKGLDGDPEENFYKLIHAVEMMLGQEIRVSLRVNLDKNNADSIEELLDILARSPIKAAVIHPAQISPYSEACCSIDSSCLSSEEYNALEARFIKSLLTKGLTPDLKQFYPAPKANYCGADQINAYIIGPNGYVYKCLNELGTSEVMVADLLKNPWNENQHKRMKMRRIEWATNSPFEIEECRECRYLPLCMGGCPRDIIKSSTHRPTCPSSKANLKNIVMDHFYCIKIRSALDSFFSE